MTIISGAATGILALSACTTETYEYEVSGIVQGQQIDYDCPGEDIALDTVAFEAGKGRGTGSGKKKKNADADDSGEQAAPQGEKAVTKAPSKTPSKAPTATAGPNNGSKAVTPSPTAKKVSNKGVKLKSKPEKPERLKGLKIPKALYKAKPKGCETEYEIFVLANDGYLYEQDIRRADYESCEKAKIPVGEKAKVFPLCTKG